MDGYWKDRLNVIVECTTYCNAKCPQCSRTKSRYNAWKNKGDELFGLEPVDWMPLKHWTLEDFKNFFPPETLEYVHNFHFSGSLGDPGMNPYLLDIVQYIHDNKTKISINTNGSMQDELFWWKISLYADIITFDVDGINQEMHAKYRRNTNLDKVLANMKSASEGAAKIRTFTVLFKHNEDYWTQIQQLCKANGADECTYSESSRFHHGTTFEFINEDGEVETLEQITKSHLRQDRNAINRRVRDHTDDMTKYNTIDCIAMNAKSLHINNAGIVWPCCYIANPGDRTLFNEGKYTSPEALNHPVFRGVVDNIDEFSLHNHRLEDIVRNKWYTETLPNSFNTDPLMNCKRTCGKCK